MGFRLQIYYTSSIRIRSRSEDILEKPLQHNSDQHVKIGLFRAWFTT